MELSTLDNLWTVLSIWKKSKDYYAAVMEYVTPEQIVAIATHIRTQNHLFLRWGRVIAVSGEHRGKLLENYYQLFLCWTRSRTIIRSPLNVYRKMWVSIKSLHIQFLKKITCVWGSNSKTLLERELSREFLLQGCALSRVNTMVVLELSDLHKDWTGEKNPLPNTIALQA